MLDKEQGAIFTMRMDRGISRQQLSTMAGVSNTTAYKIETESEKLRVNHANLDAVLIALATRAPFTETEIDSIIQLSGRRRESIVALNTKASSIQIQPNTPERADKMDLTPMERLAKAFKILEAAGQSELALAQIELLAETFEVDPSTVVSAQKKVQGETNPND